MSVASALKLQNAINARRSAWRLGGLSMLVAADFMTGGAPTAAEAYDRKGVRLATFARSEEETFIAFRERVREAAHALPGAVRVKIGGFAREPSSGSLASLQGVPRGAVALPEIPLHVSQLKALELIRGNRRVALVAGRRWGKTVMLALLAIDAAISGRSVGVFCPTYKLLGPMFEPVVAALRPLPGASINRTLGEIRLEGGGSIDFWSLDYTARAGRGRRYHLALIDEAAHDEGRLADSFPASIAPALMDFNGAVVTASTPNGLEGWFHDIAHDPRHGFVVFHAPTVDNPHLSPEGIAQTRAEMPRPEQALQELDALFLDTGGATIFPLALLLENGEPHPDDFPCQMLGLAIDSNSGKGGPDRDGCAAVVFGLTMPGLARGSFDGARVVLLDWDIQSLAQGGLGAVASARARNGPDMVSAPEAARRTADGLY